ncbi:MAG: 50S ribosomal protein L18 [Candidatus Cloacimonetes bacterium]|nr:50S ribosomal protein L18 [Candidatus Cloacimonadota bacterium]MCF7814344.1 50S ribosomal protein L18 [Candidatus Cloacimonadota bacterium]MCF7868964.1 50S ribosomal protein L18 [Candidatus Cloacimonadota bacterium]MCF7884358.1 50S ribosomal protein L18 [Candidatus Cloacimonadota bacterium]
MDKTSATYKRTLARTKRRKAIRKKIFGTPEKPRLAVFRSLNHIRAQIIDDTNGTTMLAFSSFSKVAKIDKSKKKTEQSFEVGKKLGEMAIAKGIKEVCFDRGGYLYHGRVKALADGARKAGLKF